METGNKHSLIVQAIQKAESGTKGEIRVHISRRFFEHNALQRCEKLFYKLKMHHSPERNGVLLYVNTRRKKLAIFGDIRIHEKVGQNFWIEIIHSLRTDLQNGDHDQAISQAVLRMGEVLKKYFPLEKNKINKNDLNDEVSKD